ALAGAGEDGVAYRRRERRHARFADAAGRRVAGHDVNLYRWHLIHSQHRIIVEVALLHSALVNRALSVQRRSKTPNDAPFHLRFHRVGIDEGPAVNGADHAMYPHLAVLHDRDFEDLGVVAADLKSVA